MWVVIDVEKNKLWMYFLFKLKDLIGDTKKLVFVFDRKKSIEKAIFHLFPLSYHGCWMWHMKKNLIQRYNSASSILLFKRAATTYYVEEFEWLMGPIRTISTRYAFYFERVEFTYWSRAHFVGDRYNFMTNNNVENLNSMLRYVHCLSNTLEVLCRNGFMNIVQMLPNVLLYWCRGWRMN